jgi:hypothetical protein
VLADEEDDESLAFAERFFAVYTGFAGASLAFAVAGALRGVALAVVDMEGESVGIEEG